MKKIFTVLAIIVLASCGTQKAATSDTPTPPKTPKLANVDQPVQDFPATATLVNGHLSGLAQKSDFNQEPFATWFNPRYEAYSLDEETKNALKKGLKGVQIKAFMGTWCGDSKREVPQFYKMIDEIGFSDKNLTLVTVDRSKKEPAVLVSGNNIVRVPTFIFYRNGEEIGRYVERPRESLEADILKIVTGEPYKHSYEN